MLKEFKEFITKGNVLDLAVAVVIGAAFTLVVNSLVKDVLMPLIAAIVGQPDFSDLSLGVGDSQVLYGNFLTALINFLIVAAVIYFLVIVPMQALMARVRKPADAPPAADPEDIVLLREIRDSLRAR